MVEENKNTESKLSVKMLGTIAGIIITILGAFSSAFIYIDGRYVNQDIYDVHITENEEDLRVLDEKTAGVIVAMQEQNQLEFNRVYKAIKDGTALPLVVRRDILLARGDNLNSNERAELNILEVKLDELNVQE